ncbi:MAG: hypothetical protein AB7P20_06460 [Rhizobiaceae bacterium]
MVDLPKVSIDIGAKAEVKTEIPSESSGRFLDAITDIIRPFSERRGLRADLIRLQREEVAYLIAKEAKRRIELDGRLIGQVPNKFLIPLLEDCSLEDITDEKLIGLWAALLADAVVDFRSAHYLFARIIKEITAVEAVLFELIASSYRRLPESPRGVFNLDDAPDSLDPSDFVIAARDHVIDQGFSETQWPIKFVDILEGPGLYIDYIGLHKGNLGHYPYEEIADSHDSSYTLTSYPSISFEILRSVGLISRLSIDELVIFPNRLLTVRGWKFTRLGVEFFNATRPKTKFARS